MADAGKYKIPLPLQPFASDGAIIVRSPGRINLLGEHTDYNDGFVLPAAIDKAVYVAVEKTNSDRVALYSTGFEESIEVAVNSMLPIPGHWATYILGVVDQFQKRGCEPGGFDMTVHGDIPMGAGLSSSAAIECASAFALNELFGFGINRTELAMIAQKAEHVFAGVHCGIMDPFASLFGKKDHVMKLDCRSLEFVQFPLGVTGHKFVLYDTRVKHSLASSEYNRRRATCEEGVLILQQHYPGIVNLRDVTMQMIDECLDPRSIVHKRCSYVIEENSRVEEGCNDLLHGDTRSFGEKMFATHTGLRDKYDVSCRELDTLVDAVKTDSAVVGARMMGGGFGGCTLNIIREEQVEEVTARVALQYKESTGRELEVYTVSTCDGTSLIRL